MKNWLIQDPAAQQLINTYLKKKRKKTPPPPPVGKCRTQVNLCITRKEWGQKGHIAVCPIVAHVIVYSHLLKKKDTSMICFTTSLTSRRHLSEFGMLAFGRSSETSTLRKDWFKPFRHYMRTPAVSPVEQSAGGLFQDNSGCLPGMLPLTHPV